MNENPHERRSEFIYRSFENAQRKKKASLPAGADGRGEVMKKDPASRSQTKENFSFSGPKRLEYG